MEGESSVIRVVSWHVMLQALQLGGENLGLGVTLGLTQLVCRPMGW